MHDGCAWCRHPTRRPGAPLTSLEHEAVVPPSAVAVGGRVNSNGAVVACRIKRVRERDDVSIRPGGSICWPHNCIELSDAEVEGGQRRT